jgi:2-polyprenyl-3-methyl-5-hydroxy-6-metoxy-1,4-benzoquinol methylase
MANAESAPPSTHGAPCMLCGGRGHVPLIELDGYVVRRCENCELVDLANPPDEEALARLYSFDSGYHRELADPESPATVMHRRMAREHLDWLSKTGVVSGRMLDVGCSVGVFLDEARSRGFTVKGVEYSPDTSELARSLYGLDVQTGTVEDVGERLAFDVVTLWDVIEHLGAPLDSLRKVHGLLAPTGVVAIRTPNIDGLFPRRSYRVGRAIGFWPAVEPPAHLVQFSKTTLRLMLERAGFEVIAVKDTRIRPSYHFGSLADIRRSPKRLAYAAAFAPLSLVGPWLHAGDDMLVAARKVG